jgi:aerobic carbon-monoxide dehydrogenase small subunit
VNLLEMQLEVNGRQRSVQVEANRTLLEVLRDDLGLIGAKEGCGSGDCGACTVLVDDEAMCSCMLLAVEAEGRQITTIEGIAPAGELHPVQSAFVECGALQCGFCTPGMVLSTVALLRRSPQPTEDEIRDALAGNLCRCTGYDKIVRAVQVAAEEAVHV